jgi:hypothetical protein
MLLSIAGLFIFAARLRGLAWYFLTVVAAELILTASWGAWVNGYGIRLLLGMSVFFALGAAELIDRLKRKVSMRLVYALLTALIAANFINMFLVLISQVITKTPIAEIAGVIAKLIS